eukprot:jgi/Picsp_1/6802/NSC_04141-R1_serine decarboxylase
MVVRNERVNGPLYAQQDRIIKHGLEEKQVDAVPVVTREDFVTEDEFRESVEATLQSCVERLEKAKEQQLGYPISKLSNEDIDFSPLSRFRGYAINNVGDPSTSSQMQSNTHDFELGVLRWFGRLWELDGEEMWGYISTGGTESNLQGLFVARESFPDGILYTSDQTHFSVYKAATLLKLQTIIIGTNDKGEILYDELQRQLEQNIDQSAILNVNYGTTMFGAIDRPELVVDCLRRAGYSDSRFYIHIDAALSGIYVPLLKYDPPILSFRKLPISSSAISGHKFLGLPFPAGVIIIRRKFVENLGKDIEYIFTKDLTLTCSRSGHAALYFWYMLCQLGTSQVLKDAERCIEYAKRLTAKLQMNNINAWVNPFSITVVFERPQDIDFVKSWQLACQGRYCHVVIMPHLKWDTLETFADELIQSINLQSLSSPGAALREKPSEQASHFIQECQKCIATSRRASCP